MPQELIDILLRTAPDTDISKLTNESRLKADLGLTSLDFIMIMFEIQDKYDVTSMVVRDSERAAYEAHPQAEFRQTSAVKKGLEEVDADAVVLLRVEKVHRVLRRQLEKAVQPGVGHIFKVDQKVSLHFVLSSFPCRAVPVLSRSIA